MDNNSISQVLADVAVLMQAKGENVFKVRAHSKASDQIKSLSYPITDIAEDADKLGEIPGFGAGIIEIVQELTRTGRLGLFEELSEELPDGVLELVQIPGIGPKIAVTAANDLGISTYEQLAASIEHGLNLWLQEYAERKNIILSSCPVRRDGCWFLGIAEG